MGCGCDKRAKKVLDTAARDDNSLASRTARAVLKPKRVRKRFENVAGSFSDEGVVASQDKGQDNGDADHP